MSKKKKSQKDSVSIVFYMYTVLSSVLIPLFTEDRYFNITKAKADMFYVGTAFVLVCMLVMAFSKKDEKTIAANRLEFVLPLLFSACALTASVFSYSFFRSLFGLDGWRVGLYVITVLSVIFIYLSSRPLDPVFSIKIISVINIFIFGLVIIDNMGLDMFGMHEMMLPNQYYDYVSTIGNVNQMAGYLCLTVIYLFVTVLTGDKSAWRNVSAVTLILGMFSVILCKSDGFYLGAGVCAFAMIPFLFRDKKTATRAITLGMAFCFVSLFIRFSGLFTEKLKEIDGISRIVLNPVFSGPLLAFFVTALLIFRRIDIGERVLKAIRIILLTGMIILVTGMVVINLNSVYADYYHWGSGRGAIWYESYRLYSREYSVLQKLFGVGPDMLEQWYANLSIGFGQRVLVSHSEPIQLLMTLGVMGFSVYASMIAFTIKKIIESKDSEHTSRYCLPVLAYFGQSLVNSATITNLSLLVLFLVFVHSDRHNDSAKRQSYRPEARKGTAKVKK